MKNQSPALRVLRLAGVFLALMLAGAPMACAQAPFYQGKTISILVASSPGGGYDSYARLLSRYMGRYIPGAPSLNVVNMTGAGGNLAAAYLSNSAPKDGTAMALVLPGTVTGGLYTDHEKLRYDPSQLVFLGSANAEVDLCWARADAGVTNLRDVETKEVIMGASAEGGATREQPAVINALLGTKFKIVAGYPGTREILLAVEKGEVSGLCAMSLSAMQSQRGDWIRSGFLRMLSQNNPRGDPKLDVAGVLKPRDLARTDADRAAMDLAWSQQIFGRPFVLAHGVPEDRVRILRQAFWDALHDPALIAEAERMQLEVAPVSGEDVQALVARLYATPPEVVRRATAALAGRRLDN
jgi:tripartite-type tricarboxylate transporter receptor subunit TctC